ncbi:ArfGap-domain-containing protein [Penicillium digitatum]|uniref:Uncharacterized protein n=3 Tax=Penicillium digitatum TaxID=36651 RepID=K9F5W2_PEND2|nr:hypothetical protein PDIP_33550 [Penicillium digitatum Pd1]EKV04760.1 hypothetical protein PDIG_87520 [Penicillium digitatum PHI26]EKV16988.1 hypothetical protein PDIP_33550 [Penicillium digitatum Pd1]KAG0160104.1 hypothetical protein PDIDSM_7631 [Penicillium digitatum]QQK45793.1 ArfGap-domain-containing protein [Penicillium digitatum]
MKIDFVFLASLCANSALVSALPVEADETTLLLLSDGTTQTINKGDLAASLPGVSLSPPASPPKFIQTGSNDSTPSKGLSKRGGAQFIIPLPDQKFLDWDIAMSSIVHANEADATVSMAAGQSIANSITVGVSYTATVEKWLSVGSSISYGWTETATLTGTVAMTIPKNRWGAIVSNPLTYRRSGYVFNGQPGSGHFEYFQADSHTSSTFNYGQNSLSWVDGVITTCLGNSYPLKRCVGQGYLE